MVFIFNTFEELMSLINSLLDFKLANKNQVNSSRFFFLIFIESSKSIGH
jgi:hypothetical protein